MAKRANARSIAAKKMWKRRRAQKKTTAKTTTATKDAEASPRQAKGTEEIVRPLDNYRMMYETVDDVLQRVRAELVKEKAMRNSLDRDADTISKLVDMIRR